MLLRWCCWWSIVNLDAKSDGFGGGCWLLLLLLLVVVVLVLLLSWGWLLFVCGAVKDEDMAETDFKGREKEQKEERKMAC